MMGGDQVHNAGILLPSQRLAELPNPLIGRSINAVSQLEIDRGIPLGHR
jgi:hypothetical protein